MSVLYIEHQTPKKERQLCTPHFVSFKLDSCILWGTWPSPQSAVPILRSTALLHKPSRFHYRPSYSTVVLPYFTVFRPISRSIALFHGRMSFYTTDRPSNEQVSFFFQIKEFSCRATWPGFNWCISVCFSNQKENREKQIQNLLSLPYNLAFVEASLSLASLSFSQCSLLCKSMAEGRHDLTLQKHPLLLSSLSISHHVLCFCRFTAGGNLGEIFKQFYGPNLVMWKEIVFIGHYKRKSSKIEGGPKKIGFRRDQRNKTFCKVIWRKNPQREILGNISRSSSSQYLSIITLFELHGRLNPLPPSTFPASSK